MAALVRELTEAADTSMVLRGRTGGRPVGRSLPDVLSDLRVRGVRRVIVATTHVANGRLQREAAEAVRAAAPCFDELGLVPPLLADEGDCVAVATALDEALPARRGRVIALAGHRGPECEAAFAQLESAFWARGREDVFVDSPSRLTARLADAGSSGREVLLGPLLMALGHHAHHDVLGELAQSLSADVWPHSLSELLAIRSLIVCKLGTCFSSQGFWDRPTT